MNKNDVTDVVFINDDGNYADREPDKPKTGYDNRFEEFMATVGQGSAAVLSIYKYRGSTYNDGLTLIDKFPVDKFNDMDSVVLYLRKHWGAGDYRVIVRDGKTPKVNEHVEVIGQIDQNKHEDKPSGVENVLLQMMNQMESLQKQIINLSSNNQTGGMNRREVLEDLAMMKNIFDTGVQPQRSAVSEMKEMMGLFQTMGMNPFGGGVVATQEPEEKEPGFGDLLEKITPLIEAGMRNSQQQPQQNPTQPNNQQRDMSMWKQGVAMLLNGAKRNQDPGMYAEMILGQIDSSQIQKFMSLGDQAVTRLGMMFPEIKPYGAWFNMLFEHLKAQLGMPSSVASEYEDDEPLTGETISGENSQTLDTNPTENEPPTS